MRYYPIHLVMNVMRTRKCGTHEAFAWLAHQPATGPFSASSTGNQEPTTNLKDKENGKA